MERKYRFSSDSFFSIPILKLRPGGKLTFPLFFYLPHNDHLVLRYLPDHELSAGAIQAMRAKGIQDIWTPNEYRDAFNAYLGAPSTPTEGGTLEVQREFFRSEEFQVAIQILRSQKLARDQKKKLMAEIATDLLGNLAAESAESISTGSPALGECHGFVEDLVQAVTQMTAMRGAYSEFRNVIRLLDLGTNALVVTLSALFALGMGYIDPEVITDLWFAALLYDGDFTDNGIALLSMIESTLTRGKKREFQSHFSCVNQVLEAAGVRTGQNQSDCELTHHSESQNLQELSQLIACAGRMDLLMSGRYDGKVKSISEVIATMRLDLYDPKIFERIETLFSS